MGLGLRSVGGTVSIRSNTRKGPASPLLPASAHSIQYNLVNAVRGATKPDASFLVPSHERSLGGLGATQDQDQSGSRIGSRDWVRGGGTPGGGPRIGSRASTPAGPDSNVENFTRSSKTNGAAEAVCRCQMGTRPDTPNRDGSRVAQISGGGVDILLSLHRWILRWRRKIRAVPSFSPICSRRTGRPPLSDPFCGAGLLSMERHVTPRPRRAARPPAPRVTSQGVSSRTVREATVGRGGGS